MPKNILEVFQTIPVRRKGGIKMEITNENFLYVKYNEELDRLELTKKKTIMEKIISHKIVSLMVTVLIAFSVLNFFLIYSFVKVLENI